MINTPIIARIMLTNTITGKNPPVNQNLGMLISNSLKIVDITVLIAVKLIIVSRIVYKVINPRKYKNALPIVFSFSHLKKSVGFKRTFLILAKKVSFNCGFFFVDSFLVFVAVALSLVDELLLLLFFLVVLFLPLLFFVVFLEELDFFFAISNFYEVVI